MNGGRCSVFQILTEGLSIYDLVPHMGGIVWVTDRRSNIKKVLEQYAVVFCAAHRIDNVLERTFFQHEKKTKKTK